MRYIKQINSERLKQILTVCFSLNLFGSILAASSLFASIYSTPCSASTVDNSKMIFPIHAEHFKQEFQKSLKQSGLSSSEVGIWISHNDSTFFTHNAEKKFIPASLSKIMTAVAVLDRLHPSFKFKTQIYSANMPDEKGVIKSAIYLKGGGDPSFVSESLWVLVNNLQRSGVKLIKGDIVVDSSRFDDIYIGDDRENVRNDRAYDAPVSAMSFNWNSVNIFARPGTKANDPLRISLDPENAYTVLDNQTKTLDKKDGNKNGSHNENKKMVNVEMSVSRLLSTRLDIDKNTNPDHDQFRIRGSLNLDDPEIVVFKNISNPPLWSGYNLLSFIKSRGIEVEGKVRKGKMPDTTTTYLLSEVESKPLSQIVADMAKWSNNYVAEMLVKNLAAETGHLPASMNDGISEVNKYLNDIGLKKGDFQFINASGFTRENQFTPSQIGFILDHARHNFRIFPEFSASLPISGYDGTLRSRMKNKSTKAANNSAASAEGWVRAKTGLLNGCVGLAGYAAWPHSDTSPFTFVFLFNGKSGQEDEARQLFDQLATRLAIALQ